MQIGGSDQWGNIVNGVELIKRHSSKQVFGLTTPLITLASGAKMGKTEKGAIWLDIKLLSSYDYWQFWRNTDDSDVLQFLKMFTDLEIKKIEEIKSKDINYLKIILANEATSMLHGKDAAKKAEQTAKSTFENRKLFYPPPSNLLSLVSSNVVPSLPDCIIPDKMYLLLTHYRLFHEDPNQLPHHLDR